MIGTTVGSYRITKKVSIGGMGTVYKAEHTLIGKLAAVKVLHPELRGNREIINRFFNEAKATTQIKHPGIVEVFDFGYMPSGDGYIVMEFLEGMSLGRRLETSGKMSEGEAAMLLRGVCSALAAAHAKQIIHRDLKPDNIFLVPDPDSATGERPKLLDFGIAKLSDAGRAGGSATKTGTMMGTPTCADFITISLVMRPVVYRVLSPPPTPCSAIHPATVSIALWRPTSSTNASISAPWNKAQPCTEPALRCRVSCSRMTSSRPYNVLWRMRAACGSGRRIASS